ncbi:hypothetical protein BpHYR1_028351 [Brachionus plicatilis]|uniref:Uncharacterized protein n=1 Tax=Brachionus plicatilis TaxID=10195 RepID=A0A3M7P582_BRAPC|nr:hypothetical protein BpHYR1_028351 [Brachionus plicatilis]
MTDSFEHKISPNVNKYSTLVLAKYLIFDEISNISTILQKNWLSGLGLDLRLKILGITTTGPSSSPRNNFFN